MRTDAVFRECLRKGDFIKSAFYIRKLYDETENKEYGAFLVTVTIIEAVSEMNSGEKKFYMDTEPLKSILCSGFSMDKAEKILVKICRYVRSGRRAEKQDIFKKAVSYINKNYTKQILSANLVADEMGESQSMLANIFHKNMSMGVWEYITVVRMKEAIYLIENTGLKIGDIAQQIGYSTDETFIRTFKKTYGITPGKYRSRYTG